VIGVAALALLFRARAPEESGPADVATAAPDPGLAALQAELQQLRERVAEEAAARAELESRLASVQGELQRLAAGDDASPAQSPREEEPREGEAAPEESQSEDREFDPEVLIEAGFAARDVEAFRRRIDALAMERLYLRDQATREGWLDSSRYREESRRISQSRLATRDEYGEELYDWFLYTTKHPNRIRVSQVFEGSPADEAGVRVGDLIVRYDDRKIFGGHDLQESTVSGTAGELTPVELDRAGEEVRIYIPRGPLGIRLQGATQKPPPPR
jgi:hypothetical protein